MFCYSFVEHNGVTINDKVFFICYLKYSFQIQKEQAGQETKEIKLNPYPAIDPNGKINLQFEISPYTASINMLRETLGSSLSYLGYSSNDIVKMQLALDEIATNSIIHGCLELGTFERDGKDYKEALRKRQQNPEYSSKKVQVRCNLSSDECRFIVRDPGYGFNPEYQLKKPNEPKKRGGLGLKGINQFLDTLNFNQNGNVCEFTYTAKHE